MAVEETTTIEESTPKVTSKVTETAYWTVGRRKEAIARIKMSQGSGVITVNDKPLEEAYIKQVDKATILAPLVAVERLDTFDISIKVAGGGTQAQLDAMSLGIARALREYDENLKGALKAQNLLTRDSRMKERKKYGLKRARKAPQFSKR